MKTIGASRFFKTVFCWPTLISVIGISILISLGTWQLYRLKWKEAQLQRIAHAMQQPAEPLEKLLEKENKEPPEFRKIIVTGTFEPNLSLKWMARPYKGKVGYHLIAPFHLTSGGTVLVDCGWAPQGKPVPYLSDKETTLTLMVRKEHATSAFTPPSQRQGREIYSIQPKEIAKTFGLMTLLPYYGVLIENAGASYTVLPSPPFTLRNNHFSYALTWYFLALALAIIYVMYVRKRNLSLLQSN